jgi:hypothetical protein
MYSNESLEEYHGKYLYNISTIFFVNDSELSYESYRPECEKLYFMDLLDDSLCLDLNDPSKY